jgi:hypothetical protein
MCVIYQFPFFQFWVSKAWCHGRERCTADVNLKCEEYRQDKDQWRRDEWITYQGKHRKNEMHIVCFTLQEHALISGPVNVFFILQLKYLVNNFFWFRMEKPETLNKKYSALLNCSISFSSLPWRH